MADINTALSNVGEAALWTSTKAEYPILRDLPVDMVYSPGKDGAFGMMESYPPGETGSATNPRPSSLPSGRFGVEVYDPKAKPSDVMADITSHYLVNANPEVKGVYDSFVASMTPKQKAILQDQYKYAQTNDGEARPFDQWKETTGLPGWLRGYAFSQWPQEARDNWYTPQQKELLDTLQPLLKGLRK